MNVLVIPTYKEHETLHYLLPKLEKNRNIDKIILIDDTKNFETKEFESNKVICFPRIGKKRGYGLSLKYGLVIASHVLNADRIIQMDADHNHLDVNRILKVKGDLILGFEDKLHFSSRISSFLSRKILGLNYRHPVGGFRLWRNEVLKNIEWRKVKSKGFDIQTELLFMVQHMGYRINEVLISPNDRRYDKSKLGLRQKIRWLMMLRRLLTKRLYITLVSLVK